MDPVRLDLSALDASRDRAYWERLIDEILARAAPELARRASGSSSLVVLAGWVRPALTAAAAVVVLAAPVLVAVERGPLPPLRGVAEALEPPPVVADWLIEEQPPSLSELVLADGGDSP